MSVHEYDFGYGERLSHHLFHVEGIARAEHKPGLYAWYVRSPLSASTEEECDPYRKIFAERRFKVAASAALGERMEGRMNRMPVTVRPPKAGEELDDALFAAAFAAFSPPVYIGRSKDIRKRLRQHVDALTAALSRPNPDDEEIETQAARADTDEESSQFGARMGALLWARGLRDARGMFVKVVYAEREVATKRVELLLNRTFHPILGRL